MASNGSLDSQAKVFANLDLSGDYNNLNCDSDAGDGTKRRRVTHDYRKLSKMGYDPSVSSGGKLTPPLESKGNFLQNSISLLNLAYNHPVGPKNGTPDCSNSVNNLVGIVTYSFCTVGQLVLVNSN